MAVKVWERPESPTLGTDSYESEWGVSGTTSAQHATNLVLDTAPYAVLGLRGVLLRRDIQVESDGWELWRATLRYGPLERLDAGGLVINWGFDTTGGTVQIKASRFTVASYPAGAPDYGGSIEVENEQVRGAQITVPALKINVEVEHPTGFLTLFQAKVISAATGMINNSPFLTFAPGEILFLGATGSDGTSSPAKLSYQFAASANAAGLRVGAITGIAKYGWDYAWVKFQSTINRGALVRYPEFVYVERVYQETDLAAVLGFGR